MADEDENIAGENTENMNQDMIDQCDSLRRSNLQLREEILRLEREIAEFKKQSLIDKNNKSHNVEHYENISGPTSIHVSSIDNDEKEESNNNYNYPTELVENLRAEILQLKKWKVKATQEIVDRDRALADLEAELVKQQGDFDTSSQECMGHQRVIQELKSQIDQISIGGERPPSNMSERPISSHSHYLYPPTTSIFASSLQQFETPLPREGKFQSSFARCLNMPSMAMDQLSWLENELLDTRQRLIQTEADLMRLEEVHSSLFREHKNLQEDYERIHVYVEELETKLEAELELKIPEQDDNFEVMFIMNDIIIMYFPILNCK